MEFLNLFKLLAIIRYFGNELFIYYFIIIVITFFLCFKMCISFLFLLYSRSYLSSAFVYSTLYIYYFPHYHLFAFFTAAILNPFLQSFFLSINFNFNLTAHFQDLFIYSFNYLYFFLTSFFPTICFNSSFSERFTHFLHIDVALPSFHVPLFSVSSICNASKRNTGEYIWNVIEFSNPRSRRFYAHRM